METLVAVIQHRNEYYTRCNSQVKDINCRAFESSVGLLSTPLITSSTPLAYKTPTPSSKSSSSKSSPIPINVKKERIWNNNAPFSELWAGPAYSNSPPPSSLPMPKFSLKSKRTVSLQLPSVDSEVDLRPIAKSAPTSPTRDSKHSGIRFLNDDVSATKTLRRILNLD